MILLYCPDCQKEVATIPKMFGVRLCPFCSKILASNIPMEKGGK